MPIRKTAIPAIMVLASLFDTTNQANPRNSNGLIILFNMQADSLE
jgi:hypothetical protein